MQTLKQLCTPRQSVFDVQRRDTVLDLGDLTAGRIQPEAFFQENYITEGMKTLMEQAFRRLEGKSSQGVFKLKQAMGGGKTHNLIALGLMAQHPELRETVMGHFYRPEAGLGKVKVVAFSGRESDAPFGIWGSIAAQLGKQEHFSALYSPLQAPGQTAWETLLAGETVLILLDELPPYFENARSKSIGNSDLARVTATALSNLLVAIGREACARVCLVITDLAAAYQSGSQQISEILADFESETHRSAMSLEPVRINSDELYHILRTRIFEDMPDVEEISAVAQAYASAVRDAKQMDITNESPEQFAARIMVSYPFHPSIRDLYARFRENPGFQQTRGLIRLMRIVVSRLWTSNLAGKRYLIAAHDLDFNDRETRAEISQVNSTLENAIAHDIASEGNAVAERMDENTGSSDTQDACRLLVIASLANVPNAVIGLSIPEMIANLAEPGRNLALLKSDVLEKLATAAWYLHSDRDGKLFFKNVQNLNAKLESLVKAYQREQALRELRQRLKDAFLPVDGWAYQNVLGLPAIDEIELEAERVTLVISEPYPGGGLHPELKAFYAQTAWKNRVAFLTGSKNTYDQLIDTGKRLKAVQHILDDLKNDHVPDSDPQSVQARDLYDRIRQNFHSAVRETFTTLWYPVADGLVSADFSMKFESNQYSGEGQILALLKEKMKFTDETSGEIFRQKCEVRLFTQQSMPWNEIKRRAASAPGWQWHHSKALENLRDECLARDVWREQGGYIDKGPFPQPKTGVLIDERHRDEDSGEVTLRITPVHGDAIYYDYGAEASTASARLEGADFKTSALRVSFLVVDTSGEHETGPAQTWQNRITLKHRIFQSGSEQKMELRAAPAAHIAYTTDGSDPKVAGATYEDAFIIPRGTPFVLVYAEKDGIGSGVERFPVRWDQRQVQIDPGRPATWMRRQGYKSTKESYELLEQAQKYQALLQGVTISVSGQGGDRGWIEVQMDSEKRLTPEMIEKCLAVLREMQTNGQVLLSVDALHFSLGADLLEWSEAIKTTLQNGEVKQ